MLYCKAHFGEFSKNVNLVMIMTSQTRASAEKFPEAMEKDRKIAKKRSKNSTVKPLSTICTQTCNQDFAKGGA